MLIKAIASWHNFAWKVNSRQWILFIREELKLIEIQWWLENWLKGMTRLRKCGMWLFFQIVPINFIEYLFTLLPRFKLLTPPKEIWRYNHGLRTRLSAVHWIKENKCLTTLWFLCIKFRFHRIYSPKMNGWFLHVFLKKAWKVFVLKMKNFKFKRDVGIAHCN